MRCLVLPDTMVWLACIACPTSRQQSVAMVLRHALRNWLRNTAGQKIRHTVAEVADRQIRPGAEIGRDPPPDPAPPRVGIVFALKSEAGGLEDLLEDMVTVRGRGFLIRQGSLKGRRIVLAVSGVGRQRAAKATEALIDGHRPQWVVSAGFAGALKPALRPQDIVVADRLFDVAGRDLTIDVEPWPGALADAPGVHRGGLLTADSLVRLPKQKRGLGGKFDALAVDMESFAVAEQCRRRGVRFLALRVIYDALDDELPTEIEGLLAQRTSPARLGAALGAIWRRPASLKDLWRLQENALLSADRLGRALAGVIEQL